MKSKLRKHRRVVSLLMAIVMVFVFMSMTASAAAIDDPVLTPQGTCPSCTNGYMENDSDKKVSSAEYAWSDSCDNIGARHMHYKHTFERATICRNCGYRSVYATYTKIYCPYNGYIS